MQSDLQVDKSELSEIVCKAPEKTDEKTVEHEKVTLAEETPVESTTDLQISESQAAEIQKLPDDEADKAVVEDIELQQSVFDQKLPSVSKTEEMSDKTSLLMTSEVELPIEQTTKPVEISSELIISGKEIQTMKTDEVMEISEKPEVSEIDIPESKETVVTEVHVETEQISKESTEYEAKPTSEDVTETPIEEVPSVAPEQTIDSEVPIELQTTGKDITTIQTDEIIEQEGKLEVSEIEIPDTKQTAVSEVQPEMEQILKGSTETQAKPIVEDISELTMEEVAPVSQQQIKDTEVPVELQITGTVGIPVKTDEIKEREELLEVSEIKSPERKDTSVTEVQSKTEELTKETTESQTKPITDDVSDLTIEEVAPIITDQTEGTDTQFQLETVRKDILPFTTTEISEKEIKPEVSELEIPEKKELASTEMEFDLSIAEKKEVSTYRKPTDTTKEEITITVTPVEGQETPIFVSSTEHEAPRFLLPLTDVTVMENTTLRLEVTFTGSAEIIVKWYLDGEEIVPSDDINIIVENNRSVLVIHQVFPEDEGEYWVECINKEGKTKSTAYLTVLRKYYIYFQYSL